MGLGIELGMNGQFSVWMKLSRPAAPELLEARLAPASIALGTDTVASGDVVLTGADTLSATLHDPAGSGRLVVTGTVALGGAALDLTVAEPLVRGQEFLLIENDAADAIGGTFAGLPEGAVVAATGGFFKISYMGGDGNDVVVRALVPDLKISANGKTATFTDVDGDLATAKSSKGGFTAAMFELRPTGDLLGGAQLTEWKLNELPDGTKLTLTARPGAFGGNGLVHVGLVEGAAFRPASVLIEGDVAGLNLGDDSSPKTIASVTVFSLGRLGSSTFPPGTSGNSHTLSSPVQSFTVRTDAVGGDFTAGRDLGQVTIGGSLLGMDFGVRGKVGALTIGHDLAGSAPDTPMTLAIAGGPVPSGGVFTVLGALTVGGRVENARVLAGYDPLLGPVAAGASVGPVVVGGSWVASTLHAGTGPGLDGLDGTGDDVRLAGPGIDPAPGLTGQIARVLIKGQALGTFASASDNFGIVAEWIQKAKIGPVKLGFLGGPRSPDDRFFIAPTGPGGDGSLFDFAILETVA
jgi:hypothetical protein